MLAARVATFLAVSSKPVTPRSQSARRLKAFAYGVSRSVDTTGKLEPRVFFKRGSPGTVLETLRRDCGTIGADMRRALDKLSRR